MPRRLAKTEDKITQANTVISNFEQLRRVHHVRDNLQKVIAQVEFFSRSGSQATCFRTARAVLPLCVLAILHVLCFLCVRCRTNV